jgi:hypothetical protein
MTNTSNDLEGAFDLKALCDTFHVGRTRVYEALADGSLPAKKFGKRTLILKRDARRWFNNLPSYRPQ